MTALLVGALVGRFGLAKFVTGVTSVTQLKNLGHNLMTKCEHLTTLRAGKPLAIKLFINNVIFTKLITRGALRVEGCKTRFRYGCSCAST